VEPINNQLLQLAERLKMISPDEEHEEYILTPEEEKKIIDYAIKSKKEYSSWKLFKIYKSEVLVQQKMAEINWDDVIDRENLLQRANMIKHHDIWRKNQRIREIEEENRKQKALQELWTAKRMYQLMAWTARSVFDKELIVNDDNRKFITTLCFFFSRDERFETELGYSFKKGLWIRGISGIGKTFLLKCIEKNGLNPILILSMMEIADEIRSYGEYEIQMKNNKVIYLDDVGTEEHMIKHYGTTINFFKNFIEAVYLRSRLFNHLAVSTNHSFAEIEEKYGFRVRSRVKDMFNIIDVKGKDMRG
jgi:hypothetical protein